MTNYKMEKTTKREAEELNERLRKDIVEQKHANVIDKETFREQIGKLWAQLSKVIDWDNE